MTEIGKCEFCGKKKYVASSQFTGMYCVDCHKIVIEASQEAIKDVALHKKDNRKAIKDSTPIGEPGGGSFERDMARRARERR